MLEPWAQDIFKSIESGTWLRLVTLLALMTCVVWGECFRHTAQQVSSSRHIIHSRKPSYPEYEFRNWP